MRALLLFRDDLYNVSYSTCVRFLFRSNFKGSPRISTSLSEDAGPLSTFVVRVTIQDDHVAESSKMSRLISSLKLGIWESFQNEDRSTPSGIVEVRWKMYKFGQLDSRGSEISSPWSQSREMGSTWTLRRSATDICHSRIGLVGQGPALEVSFCYNPHNPLFWRTETDRPMAALVVRTPFLSRASSDRNFPNNSTSAQCGSPRESKMKIVVLRWHLSQ